MNQIQKYPKDNLAHKSLRLTLASIFCAQFISVPLLASFDLQKQTSELLEEMSQNPEAFMKKTPQKTTLKGAKLQGMLSSKKINAYWSYKKKVRDQITGPNKIGRAPIDETNDNPSELVDNKESMVKNLRTMETDKKRSAQISIQPWSDSYWPLYAGNIAWRYGDKNYPYSSDWLKNSEYYKKLVEIQVGQTDASLYDGLSPSEKYDLLIGDKNKSLTKAALRSGEEIYEAYNKVENWMGICHGWAPAAYNMQRPEKAITVTAVDGVTRINFYPSDIKALGSYLWANVKYPTKFIGGRCNDKDPATHRGGRLKDDQCFDTNPGTWHLAVVNQVGYSDRSFVFDATYDYEVWNQPILSYEYTYFNPKTKKPAETIEKATVKKGSVDNIRFAKFRSPNVDSVVGVSMRVVYLAENSPTQNQKDGVENDLTTGVTYLYDLELDKDGNIIGGEWYQNAHPDFLWTPETNATTSDGKKYTHLKTRYDVKLDSQTSTTWSPETEALPKDWVSVAQASTQDAGLPLGKIVDALVEYANKK